MKIAIIGYSGCGKSTLAEKLGNKHNIPVLYLDKIHWLPNWQERNRDEELKMVRSFLNENESWVVDGNYSKLEYERRLSQADKIIIMSFNRFSCLYRVIKRNIIYKGKSRSSITEGCDEKIDFEFVWWILYKGRTREKIKKLKAVAEMYSHKTVVINNQRQLDSFVKAEGL